MGMGWHTTNHVVLDCFNRIINFDSESMELLKVSPNSWTSFTSLNKCLIKGFEGNILLLSSTSQTCLDLIVNDFLNTFPHEVVSLPPDREVEFSIEFILGLGPITIALYRMSPFELKELKT